MSTDDEEGDTVEPLVPLFFEPGFVAETPCYSFEEDEREENDEEVDDDNEKKQKNVIRGNKCKRWTVRDESNKSKTFSFYHTYVTS